jgi:hypothetical protein
MISEEGGSQPGQYTFAVCLPSLCQVILLTLLLTLAGVRNELAVEYVHDISMRAKDNVFEVMNHA